jgi:PEGA domain
LLILLAIGEGIVIAMLLRRPLATPAPESGAFVVETVPAGARVVVDDTDRGETPLRLILPAGSHKVVLALGSQQREIPLDVAGGGTYAHRVEFAVAPPSVTNGDLDIRTRPAGAAVVVAGQARGRTPLTVRDLPPGNHEVLLNLNGQQLRELVTVQAGTTVQLSTAFAATSPSRASGWIAISSPVELTIVEGGQVLGTTRSPRIMVPAGRHSLDLVNERLGFRVARVVDVEDGKTAAIAPELPKGTVSVNALPWAEVWMQDRKVGDTPLANLSLTIGTHQLVFRHPSFGEQRQEVTITAGAPARVSVDMRR